jgi:hypothetical protein
MFWHDRSTITKVVWFIKGHGQNTDLPRDLACYRGRSKTGRRMSRVGVCLPQRNATSVYTRHCWVWHVSPCCVRPEGIERHDDRSERELLTGIITAVALHHGVHTRPTAGRTRRYGLACCAAIWYYYNAIMCYCSSRGYVQRRRRPDEIAGWAGAAEFSPL